MFEPSGRRSEDDHGRSTVRVVGCSPGCLLMSLAVSLVLTILLNVLIRLF
jgi:hypothetical protein